ncbi:hypothetical protein [Arcticibacterium luteifluviistationis]|uniref:Heparinase n=1 Tax=Arcticibacterium luteifluviistationis TaxID=1784714 RepID=A0A2Z4G8M8_9BACT|nr:hypothetical protein [Arcticibacterium luteifluviistationis]AWV97465.1 hypothetical protein DJ013_04485 [Arcticibacterium luteifluviistationis]
MKRRKFVTLSTLSLSMLPVLGMSSMVKTLENKPKWIVELIKLNDASISGLLKSQIIDNGSKANGGLHDAVDIPNPHSTNALLTRGVIGYTNQESAFYKSSDLKNRLILAAKYLRKIQHSDGTIDLLSTNFHSTPDTGFIVERVTTSCQLLKEANIEESDELFSELKAFLLAAGEALSIGGIHTPNHRWVVSAALVRINNLWPNDRYVKRAEEWLAEGIDLDADGQYTEKSTGIYSAIVNKALITVAHGLNKPELLDFVRKNLEMTMYFVHTNGEVVTEASNRQDKGGVKTFENYYFSYRYMAILDRNSQFSAMCQLIEQNYFNKTIRDLDHLLEEKLLWGELPTSKPFPTSYAKFFPFSKLVRIRRNSWDATLLINNPSFLTFHKTNAVLQAMRINASFFGKGQFQSATISQEGDTWVMTKKLEGPYFQPVSKEHVDPNGDWKKMPKRIRKQSEVQYLESTVRIKEISGGLEVEFDLHGTDHVPVSLELIFRPGGEFSGVSQSSAEPNAFLFSENEGSYTVGEDTIKFGPGKLEHKGLTLRGGLPADRNSPSVYLTGFTPFKHTISLS